MDLAGRHCAQWLAAGAEQCSLTKLFQYFNIFRSYVFARSSLIINAFSNIWVCLIIYGTRATKFVLYIRVKILGKFGVIEG